VLLSISAIPVLAQSPARTQSSPPPPPHIGDATAADSAGDEERERLAADMAKRAAKQRVAALKHDTEKLLQLSEELKQSVDKSDENVLALDVIKKAEEIEKLARSVKDKMKGPN
jgi:hypothetical protein